MTKSLVRAVILLLAFISAAILAWALTYPSENDPQNINYALWKKGLYPPNLDAAVGTMIGDKGREELVVGKTKIQLKRKFGYLKSPSEAHAYMKSCYLDSPWKDQDLLVIREGPWMVLFSGENATELRLCKG